MTKRKRNDNLILRKSKRIALLENKENNYNESDEDLYELESSESESDKSSDGSSSEESEKESSSESDEESYKSESSDISDEELLEESLKEEKDENEPSQEPFFSLDPNTTQKLDYNDLIKMMEDELKKPNLTEEEIKDITSSKYELEEIRNFDLEMKKITLLPIQFEQKMNERKLSEQEVDKLEEDAKNEMKSIVKNYETKSNFVNLLKFNLLESLVKDEKKLTEKLNDEFHICYKLYNLPDNWDSMKDCFSGTTEENRKNLNRIFERIKRYLLLKYINIQDILELPNITIEERGKLLELYIQMAQSKENKDISDFIKTRDRLELEYAILKNRLHTTELDQRRQLIKSVNMDINKMEDDIFKLNLDPQYKKIIYNWYIKLNSMAFRDSDSCKITEWLETAISLPYGTSIQMNFTDSRLNTLKLIKDKLDEKIYGLNVVKEEILLIVNSKLSNPYSSDNSFCLCAAPGTGKTKIIKLLADVLYPAREYPAFYQISVGGLNDVSILEGHSYTYIGSKPGKIVDALKRMKANNGILYFDEIDKIGTSRNGQEVSNSLLHITDFTQNMKYYDKYLGEIPLDLSKIWFIFSCNNMENIDPILLNRIKRQIILPEYSKKDKVEIVKKLLSDMCLNIKLNRNDIIISDEIIFYILERTKEEKGLRIVISVIESILKRIKLLLDTGIENTKEVNTGIENTKEVNTGIENTKEVNTGCEPGLGLEVKTKDKNLLKLSFHINIKSLPYIMNISDTDVLLKDLKPVENFNLHHMYI
jgi:hypothetical protein